MREHSVAGDGHTGILDTAGPSLGIDSLNRNGLKAAVPYGIAGYAAIVWLLTTVSPAQSALADFVTDWMATPVQLCAAIACARATRNAQVASPRARTCWALLCAASLLSIISLIYWNLWQPRQIVPWLATGDILYLGVYVLIAAALASLLAQRTGTLRSPLLWLDGLSVLAAVLASIWVIIYGPLAPPQATVALPLGYMSAYAIAAALLLTFASLVWLRKPTDEIRQGTVALVAAGMVQAVWIIGWIGSWLANSAFLAYLADYGEVAFYSLVAVAALRGTDPLLEVESAPGARHRMFVFLPTLALLVSIALISGLLATHAAAGAWVVAGLTVLCVLLLATRHCVAVAEFERLRDELAQRESDERISELVRQSSDAFMIVTRDGKIGYASPAIEVFLGATEAPLVGADVAAAFRGTNAAAIRRFLNSVRAQPSASACIELTMAAANGEMRIARLVATNRLENARIRGIAVVVTDISKERALEREVIDVANAERFRLAGDVHDGIGQELTGIALLLQRFVNFDDAQLRQASMRGDLAAVISHLNRTIGGVRDLARGLSPLYEVHGSLTRALRTLDMQSGNPSVVINVDPDFDDRQIQQAAGEHLYRIAAEAVQNARRHAACERIHVSLTSDSDLLVLSIVDDGKGYVPDAASVAGRGAGLRIMEYRARVVGAALQIQSQPTSGTRVMATMPLPDSSEAFVG